MIILNLCSFYVYLNKRFCFILNRCFLVIVVIAVCSIVYYKNWPDFGASNGFSKRDITKIIRQSNDIDIFIIGDSKNEIQNAILDKKNTIFILIKSKKIS